MAGGGAWVGMMMMMKLVVLVMCGALMGHHPGLRLVRAAQADAVGADRVLEAEDG